MKHVWVTEKVEGEQTEDGFDGWSLGYVDDGRYLSMMTTWDEQFVEKVRAALELYEAVMELPNYDHLPPVREVPVKKKTRARA